MSNFANDAQLKELAGYMGSLISVPQVVQNFTAENIYSEDERMIGRWIDGKPVYQKVIVFDYNEYSQPHNISNLDKAVDIGGTIDFSTSTFIEIDPAICYSSSSNNAARNVVLRGNNIIYRPFPYGTQYTNGIAYIFIKYTKSTDTASDYHMASPYEFSTNETLIGTWIDGSPVYQKTITGLNISAQWDNSYYVMTDDLASALGDIDPKKVLSAIARMSTANDDIGAIIPLVLRWWNSSGSVGINGFYVSGLSGSETIKTITIQYFK